MWKGGPPNGEASDHLMRLILVEWEIITEDFCDFVLDGRGLFSIIIDIGWRPICQHRVVACPNMVVEFYRAMGQMEANEDSFSFVVAPPTPM